MDIFIYSDESGVFDRNHDRYFVFGGVVFLSAEARDNCLRKYIKAERDVKRAEGMDETQEAKASAISNKHKGKLFRAMNNQFRFGVVVDQQKVFPQCYQTKFAKQRYQDYAYKIAVKRFFEKLIAQGTINPNEVRRIIFFVDEHTVASDGRYELTRALEQELIHGTLNFEHNKCFPPLFPKAEKVTLQYCNSSKVVLIRAADVIANRIYYQARINERYRANEADLYVIRLP